MTERREPGGGACELPSALASPEEVDEVLDLGGFLGRKASDLVEELPLGVVRSHGASGLHGAELWRTDGTVAGTELFADLQPGGNGSNSNPGNFAVLGDLMVFNANVFPYRSELWVTDGTREGTKLVLDVAPGSEPSSPRKMRRIGSEVWFTATRNSQPEVWRTDGTTAGTVLVKTFPNVGTSEPDYYAAAGPLVLFSADDIVHGNELWASDGTPAGTVMVIDIDPGVGSGSFPTLLMSVHDVAVFCAFKPFLGFSLFASDGTAAGTIPLVPGCPIKQVGTRAVFFVSADELWKTDGTVSGTVRVADINPSGSGSIRAPIMSGGNLLFLADDGVTGEEMWSIFPGATAWEEGYTCAAPGNAPHLAATDPAWQTTWTISGDGFAPGTGLWLLNSLPVAPTVLGSCTLFVDPNAFGFFYTQALGSSSWSLSIPLPTIPALQGLSIVLQAFQGPTAAPLGGDFSNAVVATFGG